MQDAELASDIMLSLKEMFSEQGHSARLETMRQIYNTKMAEVSTSHPKSKGKGKKKKDFTKQDGKQIALGVANIGKKKDYAKGKCCHCGDRKSVV